MKAIIVFGLILLAAGGFVYKETPVPVYALSDNKQYGVFIQPVYETGSIPLGKEDRKKLRKGEQIDSSRYRCKAYFFHRSQSGDTTLLWEKNLLNKYGPRQAYVTSNGQYLITMDDWGVSSDQTRLFVVIYDSKGLAKKAFSLEQLLGEAGKKAATAQWDKARKTKLLSDATLMMIGPHLPVKGNLLGVEEYKADTIEINLNTLTLVKKG